MKTRSTLTYFDEESCASGNYSVPRLRHDMVSNSSRFTSDASTFTSKMSLPSSISRFSNVGTKDARARKSRDVRRLHTKRIRRRNHCPVSMPVITSMSSIVTDKIDAPPSEITSNQEVVKATSSNSENGPLLCEPFLESNQNTPHTSSSHRPIRDDEISCKFNYGSEEDTDKDEDDDTVTNGFPVISKTHLYKEEEEDDEHLAKATLLSWPSLTVADTSILSSLFSSPPPLKSSSHSSLNLHELKPTDLFDFQWSAFPNPQIAPNLRRETFSNIVEHGPTARYVDPYESFTAIWDREIMNYICYNTNLYANHLLVSEQFYSRSRITQWQDINIDELYVYFAVILAMGVVVKKRLEDYWSNKKDIFITPGYSTYMTRNRFILISKCLHFNYNSLVNIEGLTRSQAKMFKVQPIIDHLNNKFSGLYNLGQNIALDESLTQRKGLLGINQFNPNKAAATGIKTYELCEPSTGYLWKFDTDAGVESSQDSSPESGAISSIIQKLLHGLENKGHTIWMDKYYSSPVLARILKSKKFDCVGTLRTNRQFVPVQLATLHKSQMRKGQIAGCTSGDVDLLVWRDTYQVALISTYHGAAITLCNGILKPTLIYDYNLCMGGVDKKDQMLAMYPIERKRTKVWYKKFFRRLLNVSVFNSYILYKHNVNHTTHHDFRLNLIVQILEHHHRRPQIDTDMNLLVPPKFSDDVLNHLPAELGLLAEGKGKLRRKCVVCKERTHTYCPGCDVPLCIFRKTLSSSFFTCFRSYHT